MLTSVKKSQGLWVHVPDHLVKTKEDFDFMLKHGSVTYRSDDAVYSVTTCGDAQAFQALQAWFDPEPVQVCQITVLQEGDKYIFGFMGPDDQEKDVTIGQATDWKGALKQVVWYALDKL